MYRIQKEQQTENTFNNVGVDRLKSQLVDYIYNTVDLSRFKFLNLEGENQLSQLLLQKYFISANFSGTNCLLVFAKIKEKYYSFIVERKTLSYMASKVVLNNVKLMHVRVKLDPEIYKGTIFDGTFIQKNNKKTFVITDVFAFKGNRTTDSKIDAKLLSTLAYLKSNYNENDKDNDIILAINKLYQMRNGDDIKHLVDTVIPKIKEFNIRGICFFPEKSGTKLIYLFGNENKTGQLQETIGNHATNQIESQKQPPLQIQVPVAKKITKIMYIPKNNKDESSYVFEMKKGNKTDVYILNIVEMVLSDGKKHLKRKKVGLALVPNMARSKWCKEIMNETDGNVLVKCKYHKDKKKWEPIEQSNEKKPSLVTEFNIEQIDV